MPHPTLFRRSFEDHPLLTRYTESPRDAVQGVFQAPFSSELELSTEGRPLRTLRNDVLAHRHGPMLRGGHSNPSLPDALDEWPNRSL